MLKFACFVPHTPLLIPEVGQANLAKLADTVNAYKELAKELYSAKPEVLLIISPHVPVRQSAFSINQAPELNADFKKFGDLVTNLKFVNDTSFAYQIKELCETSMSIVLTADSALDYGTTVPLFLLAQNLSNTPIVSIGTSDLAPQEHFRFGEIIRKQINKSGKRVAVIASGDLSHRLHKDSPQGFSDRAQEFDQSVLKLLNSRKISELLDLDKTLIEESGQCGLNALLILLGIIKDINYQPRQLSYQSPFGIGYLVENFQIN